MAGLSGRVGGRVRSFGWLELFTVLHICLNSYVVFCLYYQFELIKPNKDIHW